INSVGRTAGTSAMPFYGSGYAQNNNFKVYIAELNTRISNQASNKLQVGYSALRDYRALLSPQVFPLVDILDGSGNPFTSFGNEQFSFGNLLSTDIYQLSDIFSFYKGRHEITFGTQNYYRKYKNGFSPSYQGVYRFNSLADFYASAAPGSTRPAARYDLSYAFSKDGSFPFATPSVFEMGLFAQDKWRILPNLTLTYGLRVDMPFFQAEFTENPNIPALTFRDGKHVDVGQKPKTSPNLSPRVGFNWDVKNDQVTQIRGGAGLFSGPPPIVWISNQASNNGVQFGSIIALNSNVFSPDVNKYRPTSGSNTAYSINVTDNNFRYPQVLKATLAIDRKLPGNLVFTLEGNFSKDVNNVNFENINLPKTGTPLAGSDNRIRYSANKIYAGTGGASATNPNIGNAILMKNYSKGFAYYATAQLQRTFRNLYVNAAYTFSTSKDLNIGGSTAATLWGSRPVTGDPNTAELGFSNFYVPHRVIASASYRVEYA
ncbi:MAG: TonB-dependent receptor, partial [Chitinophagaceae bacterium]